METRELCQKISTDILANYLNEAPPDYYHTISIIIHVLWYFDVTLDKDALLAFTYRLHGIKCEYLSSSTFIIHIIFIFAFSLLFF